MNSSEWAKSNPDKARAQRKSYFERNKEKLYASRRAWAERNRESLRERAREHYHSKYKFKYRDARLMADFGITREEYDHILLFQGNRCAICQSEHSDAEGREFAVDHDHFTGKVRGVLCRGCNVGLGNLRDDVSILERAVRYLKCPRGILL